MKLSTKTRYALRALLDIAAQGSTTPVSIKTIAQRQQISEGYLESIFSQLKKGGLIQSIRGQQGGYQVTKALSDITVYDILITMEKDFSIVQPQNLDDPLKKVLQEQVWSLIDTNIKDALQTMTLDSLQKQHSFI